ncbi:MAG: thioredoxin family protein [Flavobacteriaceae bacterium]|nr:thioredoxin family protein [Flavobacteriaceae bacterium]
MKTLYSILLFVLFSNLASGQQWLTNFEEAKKQATEKNQNIVLVFQGTDWCAPCIKLDKEIWSTETFKSQGETHFVMLKADFPRKRKTNWTRCSKNKMQQLAEKYNKSGYFPFVVLLDKEGNVLGEMGYKKTSPDAYIEELKSFEKKS